MGRSQVTYLSIPNICARGGLACCNSRGRRESDTTERLNGTELNICAAFDCHTKWMNYV